MNMTKLTVAFHNFANAPKNKHAVFEFVLFVLWNRVFLGKLIDAQLVIKFLVFNKI
jgi:hypothetical protein